MRIRSWTQVTARKLFVQCILWSSPALACPRFHTDNSCTVQGITFVIWAVSHPVADPSRGFISKLLPALLVISHLGESREYPPSLVVEHHSTELLLHSAVQTVELPYTFWIKFKNKNNCLSVVGDHLSTSYNLCYMVRMWSSYSWG